MVYKFSVQAKSANGETVSKTLEATVTKDGHGFSAFVLSMPGCRAHADNLADLQMQIQQAAQSMI